MPESNESLAAMIGSLAHNVLAVWATLHVLLNKRDTSAAVGWIGLVWLSPFIGSLIYFALGVNRVRRRARRLRGRHTSIQPATSVAASTRRDHLAQLDHAVSRLTGRPLVGGNRIGLLQDGDGAYPEMIAAIDAAAASVALSTYIFRGDAAGARFVAALSRARGRGVEVRILVDGIGGGYFFSRAFLQLRAAGVPVAAFMHSYLPWQMPFLNLRNHRKLLLIDGRIGFIGGLNIGDENVLAGRPGAAVRDMHFRVEGPVVHQMTETFADDWHFTTNERLHGRRWFPTSADDGAGAIAARVITSGPDQDVEKIEFAILQAISCAQRSIRIMTPYFLPDERVITALALAAMRGVGVELLAPERSNHLVVNWAMGAHMAPLLEAGCSIRAVAPPFNHAKIMTIDGGWALIGSANMDVRSLRLNFEANMEVYDAAFVRRIEDALDGLRTHGVTLDRLRSGSLFQRVRDAGARLLSPYL